MFEFTPWQTWTTIVVLGFATYDFCCMVNRIARLIQIKRKVYHI